MEKYPPCVELLLCGTVIHWHLELVELPATRSFNGKREMNEKGEYYVLSKVNLLPFLFSLSSVYQYLCEPHGCNWSWAWSVKVSIRLTLCSFPVLQSLCKCAAAVLITRTCINKMWPIRQLLEKRQLFWSQWMVITLGDWTHLASSKRTLSMIISKMFPWTFVALKTTEN